MYKSRDRVGVGFIIESNYLLKPPAVLLTFITFFHFLEIFASTYRLFKPLFKFTSVLVIILV